jgi:hypothetical protein
VESVCPIRAAAGTAAQAASGVAGRARRRPVWRSDGLTCFGNIPGGARQHNRLRMARGCVVQKRTIQPAELSNPVGPLTRKGYLIEEQGHDLPHRHRSGSRARAPASGGLHYRIALGPRAGQKYRACKPFLQRRPPRGSVPTRRALASMPRCAAPPISARNSEARHRCYVGPPALPFSALVNQSKGERR